MKDLRVGEVVIREAGSAQVEVIVVFKGSKWKHDADLSIRYRDVIRFETEILDLPKSVRVWPESRRLGDVQLDEILPTSVGCSHELKLTGGMIFVECADLDAEWQPVAHP
ncbi:hypothetical protein [Actinomadura flavalba]|uniref:hypothetical protein n=1 Tax=Actinomadura flavalba TaxID=1120938 RepID=UPI00196A192D|nr:hypothetical protein [Actinomadura flavalba]